MASRSVVQIDISFLTTPQFSGYSQSQGCTNAHCTRGPGCFHRQPPFDRIKDTGHGILALGYGDHAVLELQFRCGDGRDVLHDHDALSFLAAFLLPWKEWDGLECIHKAFHEALYDQEPYYNPAGHGRIVAEFDRDAIAEYYKDYSEGGRAAHIRTHFGNTVNTITEGDEEVETLLEAAFPMMGIHTKAQEEEYFRKGLNQRMSLSCLELMAKVKEIGGFSLFMSSETA